jgi:hypothetical protein
MAHLLSPDHDAQASCMGHSRSLPSVVKPYCHPFSIATPTTTSKGEFLFANKGLFVFILDQIRLSGFKSIASKKSLLFFQSHPNYVVSK